MTLKVKDANKSSLKTKAKIRDAFLKLLPERKTSRRMKVTELCREAGIQRSTFYIHYKDIYDVEDSLIEAFYRQILNLIPETINNVEQVKKFYWSLFEIIFENKSALESIFKDRESIAMVQSTKVKIKRAYADSLLSSDKEFRKALSLILYNGVFTSAYENLIGVSSIPLEEIRDQAIRVADYLFKE